MIETAGIWPITWAAPEPPPISAGRLAGFELGEQALAANKPTDAAVHYQADQQPFRR
jgi:hypothetical protein